ncbi:DNA polymerase/3'-5' exonuclease PolX [Candidatus Woesearchaeota archaeon]|nr:DNA polymerase/3'-5' exonuclease PolX [Candidatus Woesearchaeota archaeon]
MINSKIAEILYEIAEIYEIKGVQWKPQAYNKAARAIENLSDDMKEIYEEKGVKGLDEIPGVGKGISKKIEEYIKTGKINEYNKLKNSIPRGLLNLLEIQGIGPKKAAALYKKLKIKNLKDLEKAVREHKIKELEKFGEKSEEDIKESLKFYKRRDKKRFLLGEILPIAENIVSELKKLKEVDKAVYCGSLRRMNETIGDLDILATGNNPKKIIDNFVRLKEIKKVLAKGSTKSMVFLDNNLQVDIRVVKDNELGSALQYFTGNKDHGIKLRQIAIRKGYKLSEYGLFRKDKKITCSEEGIYNRLGMQYIPAELRENTNEIEIAMKRKIPKLVGLEDIKGDLHMHTKASDGNNSIKEMAEAAKKLNYEYIAITDHSKSRGIAGGLKENELIKHINEIKNTKIKGLNILAGSEVDIMANGELDYDNKILKKLDIVVASIHSGFNQSEEKITSRIVNAIENENVNIIGHPTGRLINRREGYKINLDAVYKAAKKNNKLLEINSQSDRLDLNWGNIKEAIDKGVKLAINTDAHSAETLWYMKLGVGQARKGWCKKSDIVNTLTFKELKKII